MSGQVPMSSLFRDSPRKCHQPSSSGSSGEDLRTHARIQRWLEFLSAYQFELEYRKTPGHTNSDFLSRQPVEASHSDTDGDSRLRHPHHVHMYFVRASGRWPEIHPNRANSPSSISDTKHFCMDPRVFCRSLSGMKIPRTLITSAIIRDFHALLRWARLTWIFRLWQFSLRKGSSRRPDRE